MIVNNNNYKDIKLSLYIHQIIIENLINENNKYYLVCKYWFNTIQKSNRVVSFIYQNEEISLVNHINYRFVHVKNENELLNQNQIYQKFNNQYSIYNFNYLNQLKIELNGINQQTLFNFISRFKDLGTNKSKLNKVILICDCKKHHGQLKTVYNLVKHLENENEDIEIEIELYSFGNHDYNSQDLQDTHSLENFNCIKNVSLISINIVNDSSKSNFIQNLCLIMKLWKVTSLSVETNDGDDMFHIDYEFLSNFKLKYIKIDGDFINLSTINKILNKNISLNALDISIDYCLLLNGDQNHSCQLLGHDINLLANNSIEDWSMFCNLISNHHSLKGLILRNKCKNNSIFDFSYDPDYESIMEVDSTKEELLVSNFLLLQSNQNLKVIGLDNFTKFFISNTLKSITANRNKINTILIYSILDKSRKEIQQTYDSTSFKDLLKSIFIKDKTTFEDKDSYFNILLETLKKNTSIRSIIFNSTTFTKKQQSILGELCIKLNIDFRLLYEYANERYYYNIENPHLKSIL